MKPVWRLLLVAAIIVLVIKVALCGYKNQQGRKASAGTIARRLRENGPGPIRKGMIIPGWNLALTRRRKGLLLDMISICLRMNGRGSG